jgi:molybdate/tungstate transport system substrate-binding protein
MANGSMSAQLSILHAGSLSGAFTEINREFQRLHPDIVITDEPGGSANLVRDVIKGKTCSVLASADYNLLSRWMFPDYADWCILFAANQMVLRYSGESPYAAQINAGNWYEILLKEDVTLWHSDPDRDPGGYRALMVLQLAEKYYNIPGFYDTMRSSHCKVLDKSAGRINQAGYSFSYGIPTRTNGAKYITLPDEINLSNAKYQEHYTAVAVKISGAKEGESLTLCGESIRFGITIPRSVNCADRSAAVEWIQLLLSTKGAAFLKDIGMVPIQPVVIGYGSKVPEKLLNGLL